MVRFAVFAAALAFLPTAQAKDSDPVRKLAVDVDTLDAAKMSGQPGVTVLTDEKEMVKSLGKAIAKQVSGKVNVTKESLVHVSWGSSGPPFGELKYEIKDTKDGKAITFFILEPKVDQRGMAYRLGNDFFAVPKAAKVNFGGTR